MDFDDYQARAAETAKLNLESDKGRQELVFGLVSEVGSLARAFKLYLRDDVGLDRQRERLLEDIGDVQWYVAMIAKSLGFKMSEIAEDNLSRTRDRYPTKEEGYKPTFEKGYPPTEVFPRRMLFEIKPAQGKAGDKAPHASFWIVDATPYVFEIEEVDANGKRFGFALPQEIGDSVNDNSAEEDGYRYHDAVHVAFMAVLGWSPVMRQLLRVKRKSDPVVDQAQDGARARDLEEALSAILKAFSTGRNGFITEDDVDGETRDIIRRVIVGLEVAAVPIWLWARAIVQGYVAMASLREHGTGWLIADLDAQSVEYHRDRPDF